MRTAAFLLAILPLSRYRRSAPKLVATPLRRPYRHPGERKSLDWIDDIDSPLGCDLLQPWPTLQQLHEAFDRARS